MPDGVVALNRLYSIPLTCRGSPDVTAGLARDTGLFGNLPELDSMAVATVLTALEDRFNILIDDDEVSGELFETIGSLADFVAGKLSAS